MWLVTRMQKGPKFTGGTRVLTVSSKLGTSLLGVGNLESLECALALLCTWKFQSQQRLSWQQGNKIEMSTAKACWYVQNMHSYDIIDCASAYTCANANLEALRGNKTLDLGHLDGRLLALPTRHLTLNPILLLQLVSFVKGKELADACCTLGTKAPRNRGICEARKIALSLLHDHQVENLDLGRDDATANTLPLPLTLPALAIARGPLLQEQADTLGCHDTLLHGETLLVVASRDLEDVTLELIAQNVTNNLLVHTLIVEIAPAICVWISDEGGGKNCVELPSLWERGGSTLGQQSGQDNLQLALILDLDDLLAARGRVRDVKLQRTKGESERLSSEMLHMITSFHHQAAFHARCNANRPCTVHSYELSCSELDTGSVPCLLAANAYIVFVPTSKNTRNTSVLLEISLLAGPMALLLIWLDPWV
jgi:hypothetical protein